MIRPALPSDVPRLVELAEDMVARSVYAGEIVDLEGARLLFEHRIYRNGFIGPGGGVIYVAEHEGKVEGVIVGAISRIYHVLARTRIMDALWYHSPGGSQEGLDLGEKLIGWALSLTPAPEIWLCPNDTIADHRRLDPWMEHHGLKRYGAIWRRTA